MSTEVILVQEFPDLARTYQVSSVPLTVIEPLMGEGPLPRQRASILGARPEADFLEAVLEVGEGDEPGTDAGAEAVGGDSHAA